MQTKNVNTSWGMLDKRLKLGSQLIIMTSKWFFSIDDELVNIVCQDQIIWNIYNEEQKWYEKYEFFFSCYLFFWLFSTNLELKRKFFV